MSPDPPGLPPSRAASPAPEPPGPPPKRTAWHRPSPWTVRAWLCSACDGPPGQPPPLPAGSQAPRAGRAHTDGPLPRVSGAQRSAGLKALGAANAGRGSPKRPRGPGAGRPPEEHAAGLAVGGLVERVHLEAMVVGVGLVGLDV